MNVPVVSSNRSVSFELQEGGRVLILKDAFLNPQTNLYHDIKLVRQGWSFLGLNFGGEGTFEGIDEDAVRQIQATYGIVLKTLQAKPGAVTFSGTPKKTTFAVQEDQEDSWLSRRATKVLTSYPVGKKKTDILLSKEDAAHYKATQMTLHDAVNAGIWNRGSWRQANAIPTTENAQDQALEPPLIKRSVKQPRKPEHLTGFRKGNKVDGNPSSLPRDIQEVEKHQKTEKTAQKQVQESRETAAEANRTIKRSDKKEIPETVGSQRKDKNGRAEHRKGVLKREAVELGGDAEAPKRSRKSHRVEETTTPTGVETKKRKKVRRSPSPIQTDEPISTFLTLPVYRAKATPVEFGYDDAPFDERKRRMIAHLDRVSPVPFSAFVDGNADKKIDSLLFRKMLDAIRRLAKDPKADDADAKYMKRLFRLWFRAAYHYLDKNSKPGDGYEQILAKVSETISHPRKAHKKAKELYWRRHATLFWMTLVDLFAAEQIGIDRLHSKISNNTSINSWFFN